MLKKIIVSIPFVVVLIAVFSVMGCYSIRSGVRSGVRDGVRDGVSGMFGASSSSKSGGSDSSGGSAASSGSAGGTSTAPERNYQGSSRTVPWPSDREWARYGLSGLKQPPGTDVVSSGMVGSIVVKYFGVTLINGGQRAFENLLDQIEAIPNSELTMSSTTSDEQVMGYSLPNGYAQVKVDFLNGDIYVFASDTRFFY